MVPACDPCNNGFSVDEIYLACFLECVLSGSAEPSVLRRPKIQRAFNYNPALAALISAARQEDAEGNLLWGVEPERIRRVILKLARGHTTYESAELQLNEPEAVFFAPIPLLSAAQLAEFEELPQESMWPEIGSVAFVRTCAAFGQSDELGWQEVQEGYRYWVSSGGGVVRLVLREYLACEVIW